MWLSDGPENLLNGPLIVKPLIVKLHHIEFRNVISVMKMIRWEEME